MSETEAGASWQPHCVWGVPYPHYQHNIYPSHQQYQPAYHQSTVSDVTESFSPTPHHQSNMETIHQGTLLQQQSSYQHDHQRSLPPLPPPLISLSRPSPSPLPLSLTHLQRSHDQQSQYQQRLQVNVTRQNPYDITQGILIGIRCFVLPLV